ncbi:hypothetical protein GUITHDRAFT_119316 [Guillardia theta CCMP2712]|uniref:Uncharacterized protein n=1 Tax=Guillardia theta (strain CCMP2712) TaxID=905079 RepID=L1IE23_GUITC|nr:hypothetical protein GUITHDRAFT_119316 [Guillardia theta CCMP2712]EKX34478.1 hypothetical protein GUITHDRAFT_119316 [Guillardia theta CCMP2712]|eukprot:XP_005821458.1 hypothetical protein GUITHDRAFT_119316 [Guillardia theta CCMP2712]
MSRPLLATRCSHDWTCPDELLAPSSPKPLDNITLPPSSPRQHAAPWADALRSRMYLVVVGIAYLVAIVKVIVNELLVDEEEDTMAGSPTTRRAREQEELFSREGMESRATVKRSGFDSRKLLRPEFGQTFKVIRMST